MTDEKLMHELLSKYAQMEHIAKWDDIIDKETKIFVPWIGFDVLRGGPVCQDKNRRYISVIFHNYFSPIL